MLPKIRDDCLGPHAQRNCRHSLYADGFEALTSWGALSSSPNGLGGGGGGGGGVGGGVVAQPKGAAPRGGSAAGLVAEEL